MGTFDLVALVEEVESNSVSLQWTDGAENLVTPAVDNLLVAVVADELELNFFEVDLLRVGVLEQNRGDVEIADPGAGPANESAILDMRGGQAAARGDDQGEDGRG